MMVTTLIEVGHPEYKDLKKDEIQRKLMEWRKFFYAELYSYSEEFFKANNSPF